MAMAKKPGKVKAPTNSRAEQVFYARNAAAKSAVKYAAGDTVQRNAETAKVSLSSKEFEKARNILKPRMQLDRSRTAARGVAIEKMQEKKAAAKRAAAAIGNSTVTKKAAAKPMAKPATKAPAKTTTKAPAKAPVKKKVLVMPDKISPSKMTPAQKARYLKNPERYDG